MTNEDCFVVMPITTPDDHCGRYKNDSDHFIHVMEYLFEPAISDAGLNPIFPISKGSEIIHADIISKIESSRLVLCDMSILNANVFFELGIRTALNKPVCLVKDDDTGKVPFDTSIINSHTYSCDLAPWILDDEIKKLSSHIEDTLSKSENVNSLWKYFSLSSIGHPSETKGKSDELEFLNMQMEATRSQLDQIKKQLDRPNDIRSFSKVSKRLGVSIMEDLTTLISKYPQMGYELWTKDWLPNLKAKKPIPVYVKIDLTEIGDSHGYDAIFDNDDLHVYFKPQQLKPF